MEYIIQNLKILEVEKDQEFITEKVEELISKLNFLPKHYHELGVLKFNISRMSPQEFSVSCALHLKNLPIYISESGREIESVITILIDKFRDQVAIRLEKDKFWKAKNKLKNRKEKIQNYYSELKEYKEKDNHGSFKNLVKILHPGLERYVKRMMDTEDMAKIVEQGNITPSDVVDEVILKTFTTFKDRSDEAEEMNVWMMKETDKILNQILDSKGRQVDFLSVEELKQKEFSGLDEKYGYDISGDPILLKELEENEGGVAIDYDFAEMVISSQSEKEIIDEISVEYSRTKFDDLVRKTVSEFSLRYQAVFDLYYLEQLSADEIAKIKNESVGRIEEILLEIKSKLASELKL